MDGFDAHDAPAWLLEAFDARTTLPNGPLANFPIPLGGKITGGRTLAPKGGDPARYLVNAVCTEPMFDVARFMTEYLPLAGYIVSGHGTLQLPRNPGAQRKSRPFEIFLLRRPPFVGTVLLTPDPETGYTLLEGDMAHPHHPDASGVIDHTNPRAHAEISWRFLHDA